MSGSLQVVAPGAAPGRHDHVDLVLDSGRVVRFNDPRRFGCLLWQPRGEVHPLLRDLGPEPLAPEFDGGHLFRASRNRRTSIKAMLMDQAIVVGVGNIYAAEALFQAGIAPGRPAGGLARPRCDRLARAVKDILAHAIQCGGTTFRDFIRPDGRPGYFEQELLVYGREGELCLACGSVLRGSRLGNRSTVWCSRCQR
jgi:formamidopyrimidine-DNA glycosylase